MAAVIDGTHTHPRRDCQIEYVTTDYLYELIPALAVIIITADLSDL